MKHTNTQEHRRITGALAVLCALPILLTACSGAPDDHSTPRAGDSVGAKWGACMRDAGYDVQDPDDASVEAGVTSGPAGVDQQAFAKAGASCSERVGVKPASNADRQKWEREYAQVASCVRDEYTDFPEQEPGAFGWDDSYARGEEPAFKKKVAECMEQHSPDTQTQSVG